MKYTTIGFDWGGVIEGQPGSVFTAGAAKIVGVSPEVYLDTYFRHNAIFNLDEGGWNEVARLICDDLNCPEKVNQLVDYAESQRATRVVNTKMIQLVDRLKKEGYTVGLLSNNDASKAKELSEKGYDKHFDVVHVSAITGLMKPDPKAFEYFAHSLNCDDLKQMIFIDDSDKSLSTASEVGYTPLKFISYEKLVTDLILLNVLPD